LIEDDTDAKIPASLDIRRKTNMADLGATDEKKNNGSSF